MGPTSAPVPPPLNEFQRGYKAGFDAGFDEATFNKDREIAELKAKVLMLQRRLGDTAR
jgi:hypothetical protein